MLTGEANALPDGPLVLMAAMPPPVLAPPVNALALALFAASAVPLAAAAALQNFISLSMCWLGHRCYPHNQDE